MSSTLIDRSPDLKKLRDEGYDISEVNGHLIVMSIPYLKSNGNVDQAAFVTPLDIAGDITTRPRDHIMWFTGEFPCDIDGNALSVLKHATLDNSITDAISVKHSFSAKPATHELDDFYKKVTHYVSIIVPHAQAVSPSATAHVYSPVDTPDNAIFHYADTNTSRAGIADHINKLRGQQIGIVGLGGTGSYVLDLVSKTPVKEVHLFDGDTFVNHNAFRSPGAAQIEHLRKATHKSTYHKSTYDNMRKEIHAHPYYIDETHLGELSAFDFIFLCIDSGSARRIIAEYLKQQKIPFIDTGLSVIPEANQLKGVVRTSLVTSETIDKTWNELPFIDETDDVYNTNIQIAEFNALNAAYAVIAWKKWAGVYKDDANQLYQTVYNSASSALINYEHED